MIRELSLNEVGIVAGGCYSHNCEHGDPAGFGGSGEVSRVMRSLGIPGYGGVGFDGGGGEGGSDEESGSNADSDSSNKKTNTITGAECTGENLKQATLVGFLAGGLVGGLTGGARGAVSGALGGAATGALIGHVGCGGRLF